MEQATAPKLWEITDQLLFLYERHQALINEIEEAGGEATEEQLHLLSGIEADLEILSGEGDMKILNIARMCAQREVAIAALKGEEDRLKIFVDSVAKRRKRIEKSNEFFTNYCRVNMEQQKKMEITDGLNTVKLSKSQRVEVPDINQVPSNYIRSITVRLKEASEAYRKEIYNTLELYRQTHAVDLEKDVDKVEAQKALKVKTIPGLELKDYYTVKFS